MIIWISSYPKSGNTWLRSLISSYYFTEDGNFKFEILKNISQFPQKKFFNKKINKPGEVSLYWESAQNEINKDKKIKFLKTHNSLLAINGNNFTSHKYALGAIYIIRDPRNILTSLCNHYELTYEEGISFMTNDRKSLIDPNEKSDFSDFQYLGSWSNHVSSWSKKNQFRKMIIKYEDLEADPYKAFRDIVVFINTLSNLDSKIDEKKLNNSLITTKFETLKAAENKKGFLESINSQKTNNKIKFFNLGFKNKWQNIVPNTYHKKINSIFKEDLINLGY